MIAGVRMPSVLRPTLESAVHHYHSQSIDENIATGHTYWQGKMEGIISSSVAICQLKFAVEEGRTNFNGLLLHLISNVFFVYTIKFNVMLSVLGSKVKYFP